MVMVRAHVVQRGFKLPAYHFSDSLMEAQAKQKQIRHQFRKLNGSS
jgi:hypothetical protein